MNTFQLVVTLILVVLIAVAVYMSLPTPRSRAQSGPSAVFRDDDRYWSLGRFYNNPDDPDVFVPKRFMPGWTVNIGQPLGRMFLIGTILVPVVLALLGLLFTGSITSYGCHPSGCHF